MNTARIYLFFKEQQILFFFNQFTVIHSMIVVKIRLLLPPSITCYKDTIQQCVLACVKILSHVLRDIRAFWLSTSWGSGHQLPRGFKLLLLIMCHGNTFETRFLPE